MRDGLRSWRPHPRARRGFCRNLTPADLPAKCDEVSPGRTELSILELPLDKAEFDELGLSPGGLWLLGCWGRPAARC